MRKVGSCTHLSKSIDAYINNNVNLPKTNHPNNEKPFLRFTIQTLTIIMLGLVGKSDDLITTHFQYSLPAIQVHSSSLRTHLNRILSLCQSYL